MATQTNKSAPYFQMIAEYDKMLQESKFLFSEDGSGDGENEELREDDADCNLFNCC